MNKIMVTFIFLMSVSGFAGDATPNSVLCTSKKINLVYTINAGKPFFSYTRKATGDENRDVTQEGNLVSVKSETVLGSLVTVYDPSQSSPDDWDASVTLVLPDVNLPSTRAGYRDVSFDALVLETQSRTSIGGPDLVEGAVQRSQSFSVKCLGRKNKD